MLYLILKKSDVKPVWEQHDRKSARAQIKGFCTVAITLALLGCSALPIPPDKSSSPVTPDVPSRQQHPSVEIVNDNVEVGKSAMPADSVRAIQKSSNGQPASDNVVPFKHKDALVQESAAEPLPAKNSVSSSQTVELPRPVIVDRISRTGKLGHRKLSEVSGLVASRNSPGVLYAVNDSGDSATLYALSEKGKHIGQWAVKARNRDWEDLDNIEHNNQNYILIGDTGDNLRNYRKSTFYLVAEPLPGKLPDDSLTPYMTIDFVYEDGPRNVEAFTAHGTMIYLISKEPLSPTGASASRLYSLEIPVTQPSNTLTAKFVTELPIARSSLESKLAASFVGVDLDHITAMDITASGRTAYLLTYKDIVKVERGLDESWSTAFQRRGKRIHTHGLAQAEALTIAPGRSVFFTSENQGAPLWAIPIQTAP